MTPTLAERSDAILAILRGKKTYEAIARDFGVSVSTVQEWEASFIQAGSAAISAVNSKKATGLDDLQGRIVAAEDKLSQLGAVSAISQSLSAILTMDELVDTTLDTLRLVFGYLPTIGIVEGKDIVVKGGYSLQGERVDWHGWRIPLNTEHSILAWVGLHGRPLNLPDVTKDERYVYRAVIGDVQSQLVYPLIHKGQVLGVLEVKSGQTHAFDQNDMSVLETVSFQVAVAVENARLFEGVRRRVAELELIQSITGNAIKNLDVDEIVQHAALVTQSLLRYDGVAIGLIDPPSKSVVLCTVAGNVNEVFVTDEVRVPLDYSSVIGSVILSGKLLLANDVWYDERFGLNPLFEKSRSQLIAPMQSKDSVIGVINVESNLQGAFDDTDITTLTVLANQLTAAIRGASLFQQTQDQLDEISRLLGEVQQANARFEAVLEATDDGIVIWDENWRLLMANKTTSQLLDRSAEELIGCTPGGTGTPTLLTRLANAREGQRVEVPGEDRRVVTTRNLVWRADSTSGFLTVINEVTSQVRLEETREEMTSMLIHDLRGPMSGVVGALGLAEDGVQRREEPAKLLQFLGIATRSSNMALNMVNSLLDISRLESRSMPLERVPLQVDALLKDVLELVSGSAQAAKVRVASTVGDDLPVVSGDQNLIRRALVNLVDNAIKFSPDGAEILISAEREQDGVRFSVSDRGPGVPESFRKKIFEKYVQVPGQKGRRKGSGLGLALVRLVGEAHRGRLWVEPRAGGGSVFSMFIPGGE